MVVVTSVRFYYTVNVYIAEEAIGVQFQEAHSQHQIVAPLTFRDSVVKLHSSIRQEIVISRLSLLIS